MYIFFDTETNARSENGKFTYRQHVIQLAYYILDSEFNIIKKKCWFVKDVAKEMFEHQELITLDDIKDGKTWKKVFGIFLKDLKKYIVSTNGRIVAHNIIFDKKVVVYSSKCMGIPKEDIKLFEDIVNKHGFCTKESSTDLCKIPNTSGYYADTGGYKWPKLEELYKFLFGEEAGQTHYANDDVEMLIKCYKKCDEMNAFPKPKMKRVNLNR